MSSRSKEKEPKRFYDSGPWALAAPQPMARKIGSFLVLFFKKELLRFPSITTVAKLQRIATASAHPCRIGLL
jgi:hypothetical protein